MTYKVYGVKIKNITLGPNIFRAVLTFLIAYVPEGDAECIADAYLQARIRDSSHGAGTHRMVHSHCEVTKVAFPVLPSKIARYVFTTR